MQKDDLLALAIGSEQGSKGFQHAWILEVRYGQMPFQRIAERNRLIEFASHAPGVLPQSTTN